MFRFAPTRSTLLLIIFTSLASAAYDVNTCCSQAVRDQRLVGRVPENPICGQVYSSNSTPALPVYVSYRYCNSQCGGIGLSVARQPQTWAAPLVQFILPSVIFSMTIPRRVEFERVLGQSWPWLIFIPIAIDVLVWIFLIMTAAANMIVGGLFEAVLDTQLVRYVNDQAKLDNPLSLQERRKLLVTMTSGNLQLEKGDPFETIPRNLILTNGNSDEVAQSRLLNLLGAQSAFGAIVGAGVLFYLGGFVYTILDLLSNPSDQDSALAVGFGIE
jgi:hypothetical protein